MEGGDERWTPQQLLRIEAGEEDELSCFDGFLHWLVDRKGEVRRKDEGSGTSLLTLF